MCSTQLHGNLHVQRKDLEVCVTALKLPLKFFTFKAQKLFSENLAHTQGLISKQEISKGLHTKIQQFFKKSFYAKHFLIMLYLPVLFHQISNLIQ